MPREAIVPRSIEVTASRGGVGAATCRRRVSSLLQPHLQTDKHGRIFGRLRDDKDLNILDLLAKKMYNLQEQLFKRGKVKITTKGYLGFTKDLIFLRAFPISKC